MGNRYVNWYRVTFTTKGQIREWEIFVVARTTASARTLARYLWQSTGTTSRMFNVEAKLINTLGEDIETHKFNWLNLLKEG